MAGWVVEQFTEMPVFHGMDRSEIEAILAITHTHRFRAGEAIISEGDRGNALYLLDHGRAEVRRVLGGKTRVVASLEAKTVFGEMALLGDARRSASVVAVTDARCGIVSRADFDHLVGQGGPGASKLLRNIANLLAVRMHSLVTALDQVADRLGPADADLRSALDRVREDHFSPWSL